MSYEKQTWSNGDTITAEKLNYMEDGIAQGGSGVLMVTVTAIEDAHGNEIRTLDKTYTEIASADVVRIKYNSPRGLIKFYTINGMAEGNEQHPYYVSTACAAEDEGVARVEQDEYYADSADGVLSTQTREE